MTTQRRRANLDDLNVAAFTPRPREELAALDAVAREEGFTGRHADAGTGPEADEEIYDARIKRGPKVRQVGLNITVPLPLRNRFWRYRDAHGLDSGAEVLERLFELAEGRTDGKAEG